MGKSLPTTFTNIDDSNYLAGKDVRASDWKALIERSHYLYAHSGSWFGGLSFSGAQDYFERDSATYGTDETDAGDYDLDRWYGCGRLLRPVDGGGFEFEFRGYGRFIDVRISLVRWDTDGTSHVTTFSATNPSSNSDWFTGSTTITAANAHVDANTSNEKALFGVLIEARASGGGDARLWMFDCGEAILTASNLPTGS